MDKYFILQMMTSRKHKLSNNTQTSTKQTSTVQTSTTQTSTTQTSTKQTSTAQNIKSSITQDIKPNVSVLKNRFQSLDDETLMILLSL